jgi:hypothetical protein
MTVYAYRRLSAFELIDPSIATTAHENVQIKAYCDAHDWPDVKWHAEQTDSWQTGFSVRLQEPKPVAKRSKNKAAENNQPENIPQSHWMPKSGDKVVVHSLQRIFTGAQDMANALDWMRAQDVQLHVVSMQANLANPDIMLNADNLLRALAAMESRRAAERMLTVKLGQRSKGRFLGGSRPFGYMVHANGKLIKNPMEQRVIKQIRQLRDQGWSLRAIADKVSTPVAPISFKTVQRVLQREEW